jgi:eukaryotic-like serine/threonine-protein kinase
VSLVANFEGCEVLEEIEADSLTVLYRGTQPALGRPIFIKALNSSILPASPFAATLEREARLLALLEHASILKVYDLVKRDDRMWLVLEYLDGWPLRALLRKQGKLGAEAATAIALEVARGLAHAHQHDVVHRAIQPRNVLISRHGDVKLYNFSVATEARLPSSPELLDPGLRSEGPSYMSPEQILGEGSDPRSDIFSLGIVLFEMLSGTLPFKGMETRSATQSIRHDPPPPLARLTSGVPGALERIVYRCLEKLPSDRFSSARELAETLEGVLDQFGNRSGRALIVSELTSGGFVDREPSLLGERKSGRHRGLEQRSLKRGVQGLFLAFGLIVTGGATLEWFTAEDRGRGAAGEPLLLAPQEPAQIRVVVDPWAEVSVDGQYVDTTPFAAPIPLRAGTHYVRLKHPNAPVEQRTVRLAPGESVLLDVKMQVDPALVAPSPASAADAAAPDASSEKEWSP